LRKAAANVGFFLKRIKEKTERLNDLFGMFMNPETYGPVLFADLEKVTSGI
jgi:hypothetical protein